MSVTRRCPNCGTTQATSGDCEACHEAEVRYYCTNHTPGVWLDGTSCPHCGSRLGAPPRGKSTAPPPPVRRPVPAAVPARPRGTGAATPPRTTPPFAPSSPPPAPPVPAWDTRTTTLEETAVEAYSARPSPLQWLLEAALRARAARREPARVGAGPARNLAGCLLRLLVIGTLLFLALVAALFVFGSTLLRGNAPY